MKKSYFIMLMALAFFLFGCREELDYVNSENSLQNSDSFTKDNVVTKKLFKQDYLSNSFLKQNVEAVNNFLKQKGSSSSAALSKNSTIEGVEVYTDVFEEVDYLNAKYYSFHIAGSSSKEFEQKLVLKYVNNEIKDRYILKYKRLPDLKIDPNSYQLEKLIGSSDGNGNSLLMYIDSFTLGCTTYTVTTFNCGHQGNHSNGEYCSVENTYIPHNIISAQYNPNCNSEGGGSPSGSTTGDSGSQGSQNTNGDGSPAFLSIYSSAPYYEIEFVPHTNKLLNYLNLNPTEITRINANDNLRLQIYLYLQNLGLYPFTPYLGDEYANASELTKFALQFFAQNPTTTWQQFQNWFLNSNVDVNILNDVKNYITENNYTIPVYNSISYPGKQDGMPFEWWKDNTWIKNNIRIDENNPNEEPNSTELMLFGVYPLQASFHIKNSKNALNLANQLVTNGKYSHIHNGKADAFRHTFWNALDSADFGKKITLLFTKAHEVGSSNHPLETEMDLHNNEQGAQLGTNYSTFTSSNTIKDAVINMMDNSSNIWYLSPLADHDGNNILSNTQIKPTN